MKRGRSLKSCMMVSLGLWAVQLDPAGENEMVNCCIKTYSTVRHLTDEAIDGEDFIW